MASIRIYNSSEKQQTLVLSYLLRLHVLRLADFNLWLAFVFGNLPFHADGFAVLNSPLCFSLTFQHHGQELIRVGGSQVYEREAGEGFVTKHLSTYSHHFANMARKVFQGNHFALASRHGGEIRCEIMAQNKVKNKRSWKFR